MAYAEKVGAEVVNLPQVSPNPQWVLFHAFRESLKYPPHSRFVWIDADILITDDAPDVFDFPDKFHVCPPFPADAIHPRWKDGFKRFMTNPRPYPVNGLLAWSERHAVQLSNWYFSNRERFPKGWGDQELLAVACYELELYFSYFPQTLHRMYYAVSEQMRKQIPFLHAAGNNKISKLNEMLKWLD